MSLDSLFETLEASSPQYRKTSRSLLLVTHMRAHSTLLAHIIGSHPDVAGYLEFNQSYFTIRDIVSLRERVMELAGAGVAGHWVMDKLVHRHLVIDEPVLNRADVAVVFLVREPYATLQSILHMKNQPLSGTGDSLLEAAYQYYLERLQQIKQTARECQRPFMLIRAETLISDPAETLQQLSEFMQLSQPLVPEYEVFDKTGHGGFGDASSYIRQGTIVSQRQKYPELTLSEEQLETLQSAYRSCLQQLEVGDGGS